MLRHLYYILFCLLLPVPLVQADDSLAVVFIDDATERKLGEMPIDRSHYARAIERVADAGARGVVLKFFFESSTDSDEQLAAAMSRLPVLLQTRSGGVPVESLASRAHAVGSVDFDGFPIRLEGSLALEVLRLMDAVPADKRLTEDGRIDLELQLPGDFAAIPLHVLLETDSWQHRVNDKLVIIAYDGDKMSEMTTPYGTATPHRVFIAVLNALLEAD